MYGGRGGAKSWSVATYLAVKACEDRLRIVCARQFQNSIRDSSKELIERRIRDLRLSDRFRIGEQFIVCLDTGAEFLFVGLERNPNSIRSLEGADVVWIEEARTISQKSMDILLPTVRAPNSQLIWTWNPQDPTDPVDAYFRSGAPPENSFVIKVNHGDNPFFNQTAMPAEMLKLQRDNPARYRHIWLGEYDVSFEFEGLQPRHHRPAEQSRRHCADVWPRFWLLERSDRDRQMLSHTRRQPDLHRCRSHGLPTEQLPALLNSIVHDPGDLVRADGSRPETIDFLQRRGFGVRAARKGAGSVREGIARLQSFELLVDPGCENVRSELRQYSWPTDRLTGQVVPGVNPIGVADHCIDAIRYSVEDLIPGASFNDDPDDDGGALLIPMWGSARARDERWHERHRGWN